MTPRDEYSITLNPSQSPGQRNVTLMRTPNVSNDFTLTVVKNESLAGGLYGLFTHYIHTGFSVVDTCCMDQHKHSCTLCDAVSEIVKLMQADTYDCPSLSPYDLDFELVDEADVYAGAPLSDRPL